MSKARWPCWPWCTAAPRRSASCRHPGEPGQQSRRFALRELLTGRLRRVMIFGFGIAFFQQATGINAVFYYLPTIFAQAGGGLSTAFGQSVFVGLVNVGMTFVAIWLIDRLGRKPLLCVGNHGHDVVAADDQLGISHAQASSAAGRRSVTHGAYWWRSPHSSPRSPSRSARSCGCCLSEIFPNEERAAAISVVGFWNSLVSASVTLLFPKELATLGACGHVPRLRFACRRRARVHGAAGTGDQGQDAGGAGRMLARQTGGGMTRSLE